MKKHNRIANVQTASGIWDYRIPDYLRGKVKVGNTVVVEDEHGILGFGEVVDLAPTSPHRPCNIRTIIDKVRVKRYRRFMNRKANSHLLLVDMERRRAEIEAVDACREYAEHDKVMRGLYDDFCACKRG